MTPTKVFLSALNSIFHKLIVNKSALQLQIIVNKLFCESFITENTIKSNQDTWCDIRSLELSEPDTR